MSALPPDAVVAICRHMNEDHRADALLICQALAGAARAVDAETVGVDTDAMRFAVRTADGSRREVTVPFAEPVTERAQVRSAVVELHARARAAAGVTPSEH
jgi:putative heme iron utilization protein